MVAGEPLEELKVAASSSTPSPDDSKRHTRNGRRSCSRFRRSTSRWRRNRAVDSRQSTVSVESVDSRVDSREFEGHDAARGLSTVDYDDSCRQRYSIPLARPCSARTGSAHARHGDHQRDARLVRRRRAAVRRGARGGRRAADDDDGADILDVGGESTRPGRRSGPGRRGAAPRAAGRRSAGAATAACRCPSTPTRRRWRARPSPGARRSSTTSAACSTTRNWRRVVAARARRSC